MEKREGKGGEVMLWGLHGIFGLSKEFANIPKQFSFMQFILDIF